MNKGLYASVPLFPFCASFSLHGLVCHVGVPLEKAEISPSFTAAELQDEPNSRTSCYPQVTSSHDCRFLNDDPDSQRKAERGGTLRGHCNVQAPPSFTAVPLQDELESKEVLATFKCSSQWCNKEYSSFEASRTLARAGETRGMQSSASWRPVCLCLLY